MALFKKVYCLEHDQQCSKNEKTILPTEYIEAWEMLRNAVYNGDERLVMLQQQNGDYTEPLL